MKANGVPPNRKNLIQSGKINKIYRKALLNARAAGNKENKKSPRFLFSTVARLTESHSSSELCIPIGLSGNDFMSFFNEKIITISSSPLALNRH